MPKQIYSFVGGIFLLIMFSVSIAAQDEALKTSVCSITAEPELHLGKNIEVDAVLYSGFEMGWLKDLNVCQSTSKFRFDYRYGENYERETSSKDLKQIKKLLSRKILKPTDINKYRGTFSLRLLRYEKKNDFDTRFDYVIEILKVHSVAEVKSCNREKC